MGVTHRRNEDGTVTQFDGDTGQELVTFPDPDGSFTRVHIEPLAAMPAQKAPAGDNAERTFARALELSPKGTVSPDAGTTVSPEAPESQFQRSLKPPVMPSQETPARLPLAGTETQGLTSADRQQREAGAASVTSAAEGANAAQTQSEKDQLAARAGRVQAESDRSLGRYASDLELHELAKTKTLEAEDETKRIRAETPDPGAALGGPKFLYAIMAGVGASLSNFGAALLGQQGRADTNVVDDIVDASVKQQMHDQGLRLEGAQDQLDANRKEEQRLSIRANASLENWFNAQAAVEQDPELRAAWSSHAEERRAAIEAQTFKMAEGNYQTEVQHRAVPKPVKGKGPDLRNIETKEDEAALVANGVDRKSYAKYADERLKTGADATLKHVADLKQVVKDLKEKGSTDIPGVGPIDQATQGLLRSNDASKVQQALGQVVTTFVKNRSGAAVTDKEREYLSKIIVGTGGNQEASLMDGLRHIEAEIGSQLEVLDNGRAGESRAYGQILRNRTGRKKLTDENASGLAAQRAARAKPGAVAPAASQEPVEANPENVAEFLSLPPNNTGGALRAPARRQRSSREEELRQLLGD